MPEPTGPESESHQQSDLVAGTTVSHYEIIRKIGVGGMGEVYQAEDTGLHRQVALKFLPLQLCHLKEYRQRFQFEARTAARISHPNVATIYEVSEFNGRPFFSMEYISSGSIVDCCGHKPLSISDVLEIAAQVTDGIGEAHRQNIVHRDLKPSNILLSQRKRVKLVDFGLARVRDEQDLTVSGSIVGTIGYMSPEQVLGNDVDHRSDLYSLGVIMYELLTGHPAFRKNNYVATVQQIIYDDPQPISDFRGDVPRSLVQVIERLLRKDRAHRYHDAEELWSDLRRISLEQPLSESNRRRQHVEYEPSIAVLPFKNLSGDPAHDYLGEGMSDEIINSLTQLRGLRVTARLHSFGFKNNDLSVVEIGHRLSVDSILDGSVRVTGNAIRISASLIDVSSGYYLWSGKYDREEIDVLMVEDEIARSIVQTLQLILTDQEEAAIAKPTTDRFEAYDYYLRARQYFHRRTKRALEYARELFLQASRIDPNYSRAYAGVANTTAFLMHFYGEVSQDNLDKAESFSSKAVELDPDLADGHTARGMALWLCGDIGDANAAFEHAIALDSQHFEARYFYGRACFQQGRTTEAVHWFEEACRVREDHEARFFAAQSYAALKRHDQADLAYRQTIHAVRRYMEMNPDDARAVTFGAVSLCRTGDREEGLVWAERALTIDPYDPGVKYNVACMFSLEGETERAIETLEDALKSGFAHRDWVTHDPDLDPLRDHPRFKKLIEIHRPASGS